MFQNGPEEFGISRVRVRGVAGGGGCRSSLEPVKVMASTVSSSHPIGPSSPLHGQLKLPVEFRKKQSNRRGLQKVHRTVELEDKFILYKHF